MRDELLGLLRARRGHFLLESGHHGDLWLDLDRLFRRPAAVAPFASRLAERLAPYGISAVCGPLTGGAFLAQLVAADLGTGFVYAERLAPATPEPGTVAYRVPAPLRADLAGQRVAVVDDATNAASALRKTVTDLDACGALPVALGALLVLGTPTAALAAETNLPLESVAALPNTLWTARGCPLCASGTPLEEPVP